MEEILANAFNTGDIKIVIVAAILYFVIAIQRGNTKKDRDSTADEFDKRISLLEADNELLHKQLDTIGNKLDKITDLLTNIRIELSNKKDRE